MVSGINYILTESRKKNSKMNPIPMYWVTSVLIGIKFFDRISDVENIFFCMIVVGCKR